MMGMRMPETCWAVSERQVMNLKSCCILLVDSVENGCIFKLQTQVSLSLIPQILCNKKCALQQWRSIQWTLLKTWSTNISVPELPKNMPLGRNNKGIQMFLQRLSNDHCEGTTFYQMSLSCSQFLKCSLNVVANTVKFKPLFPPASLFHHLYNP